METCRRNEESALRQDPGPRSLCAPVSNMKIVILTLPISQTSLVDEMRFRYLFNNLSLHLLGKPRQ